MEKRINNVVSYLFIAIALVIPLLFSPIAFLSFPFAKIAPFFLVVFAGLFLWIIQSFNEGKFVVPSHPFFFAVIGVPVAYLLSGLFSVNRAESFIGLGTEVGTVSFIAGSFLFMWLVSMFVRAKNKIFISYVGIGLVFTIVAIFHTLRFFFGVDFLSFGIFTNIVSNTLGRWTDLALFAGIAVILALTSIEFLRLDKMVKVLLYVVLALGLFVLSVTNFPVVIWGPVIGSSIGVFTLIGLFSLVFFVYFISSSYDNARKAKKDEEGKTVVLRRKIPPASLIVLVVSVIFTLGAGPLQTTLASYFKVEPISEARLLWQPTISLSQSTLTDFWYRPLVGYGPEQFSYKWLLSKPAEVNQDAVWNASFDNGVGFIPSTIVTTGLIGFLAWIVFLGLFAFLGFKALFSKFKDSFSQFLTVSSFLVSLFLWITQIFYTPSIFSFIMTFFFTGIFLGSLFREKIIKEKDFVFETSKEKSFVSIMGLIIVLVITLFWGYKIGETVAASVYVSRADIALQNAQSIDEINQSKALLEQAIAFNPSDSYMRALANISLAQVNGILQNESSEAETEALITQLQAVFGQAVNYARLAVNTNPRSYDNYIVLGNVFESVVTLDPGAYEGAKMAYEQARELNPNSPVVPYLLARLEIGKKDIDQAKVKLGEALQLKPYYFDAIILLGRIQASEGKTADAIATFSVAQQMDPQNADLKAIINSLKNGSSAPSVNTNTSTDVATSTEQE